MMIGRPPPAPLGASFALEHRLVLLEIADQAAADHLLRVADVADRQRAAGPFDGLDVLLGDDRAHRQRPGRDDMFDLIGWADSGVAFCWR